MKQTLLSAMALAALAAAVPAPAQVLRFDREKTLAYDMRVERFSPRRSPAAASPGIIWTANLPPLPRTVSRIRLRIRVVATGDPSAWEIRLTGSGGERLQTIPGTLAAASANGLWTDELPAAQVTASLSWDGRGECPVLEVDRYAYGIAQATPQSVVGLNQLRPIGTAPSSYQVLGHAIARLRIMTDEGQAFCTGFLLSEDLLLTNEHCVKTADEASSLLADFGYDSWSARATVVRGATLVALDPGLDYALLRLTKPVEPSPGRLYVETASQARAQEELIVIQHPGGEPKQVSIEGCVVAGIDQPGATIAKTDFQHGCDTMGGSSGSPVLDRATGRVVGLHHFGYREGVDEPVNQAVEIRRILDHLSTHVEAATLARISEQIKR
jgi:V8-like Glu-specific endopeptidase